jgi:hypothetical protein
MMAETPTLYVCHGDDGGPRRHPCRRVQEALRAAQPGRVWRRGVHARIRVETRSVAKGARARDGGGCWLGQRDESASQIWSAMRPQ